MSAASVVWLDARGKAAASASAPSPQPSAGVDPLSAPLLSPSALSAPPRTGSTAFVSFPGRAGEQPQPQLQPQPQHQQQRAPHERSSARPLDEWRIQLAEKERALSADDEKAQRRAQSEQRTEAALEDAENERGGEGGGEGAEGADAAADAREPSDFAEDSDSSAPSDSSREDDDDEDDGDGDGNGDYDHEQFDRNGGSTHGDGGGGGEEGVGAGFSGGRALDRRRSSAGDGELRITIIGEVSDSSAQRRASQSQQLPPSHTALSQPQATPFRLPPAHSGAAAEARGSKAASPAPPTVATTAASTAQQQRALVPVSDAQRAAAASPKQRHDSAPAPSSSTSSPPSARSAPASSAPLPPQALSSATISPPFPAPALATPFPAPSSSPLTATVSAPASPGTVTPPSAVRSTAAAGGHAAAASGSCRVVSGVSGLLRSRFDSNYDRPDQPVWITVENAAAADIEAIGRRFDLHPLTVEDCVAEGALVNLADGRSVPIEEVKVGNRVLSLCVGAGETEGLVARQVDAVLARGHRSCVELLFSDGRTLVCTPDHRIRTADHRWVAAGQLVIGTDEVAVGVEYPHVTAGADGAAEWRLDTRTRLGYDLDMAERAPRSLAFARLLGYLLTDGCVGRRQSALCLGHQLDAEAVQRDVFLLTRTRPTVKRRKRKSTLDISLPRCLHRAFLDVGAVAGKRPGKVSRFPAFLTHPHCPVPVVREFLGGLFGGGGHTLSVQHRAGGALVLHGLGFSTSRRGDVAAEQQRVLRLELVALLERAGVDCSSDVTTHCRTKPPNTQTKAGYAQLRKMQSQGLTVTPHRTAETLDPSKSYELIFNFGNSHATAFARCVGFRFCCHEQQRLSAAVAYFRGNERLMQRKEQLSTRIDELRSTPMYIPTAAMQAKAELAQREQLLPTVVAWTPDEAKHLHTKQKTGGASTAKQLEAMDSVRFFSAPRTKQRYNAAERQAEMALDASTEDDTASPSNTSPARRPRAGSAPAPSHGISVRADGPEVLSQDVECLICKSGDNEARLLMCDGSCGLSFHTDCLVPPLKALPAKDVPWYCENCCPAIDGDDGDAASARVPLHNAGAKASGADPLSQECVACLCVDDQLQHVRCSRCDNKCHTECPFVLDPPRTAAPDAACHWYCDRYRGAMNGDGVDRGLPVHDAGMPDHAIADQLAALPVALSPVSDALRRLLRWDLSGILLSNRREIVKLRQLMADIEQQSQVGLGIIPWRLTGAPWQRPTLHPSSLSQEQRCPASWRVRAQLEEEEPTKVHWHDEKEDESEDDSDALWDLVTATRGCITDLSGDPIDDASSFDEAEETTDEELEIDVERMEQVERTPSLQVERPQSAASDEPLPADDDVPMRDDELPTTDAEDAVDDEEAKDDSESTDNNDDVFYKSSEKVTYGVHCDAKVLPLFRVRLVGRREVGLKRVFDLSVPNPQGEDSRSFVAAGILCHNCQSRHTREKLEIFQHYLFLVFHALQQTERGRKGARRRRRSARTPHRHRTKADDPAGRGESAEGEQQRREERELDENSQSASAMHTASIKLIVFPHLVLSFTSGLRFPTLLAVRHRLRKVYDNRLESTAWIIHAMLDSIVDALLPVVDGTVVEVDALEDLIYVLSGSEHRDLLKRMGLTRRRLSFLRQRLWSKRDILMSLIGKDWQLFLAGVQIPYLRDVYDHVVTMLHAGQRMHRVRASVYPACTVRALTSCLFPMRSVLPW